MAFITWGPQIAVNHPEIDTQHQKLIEIINRLHAAMGEGKGKAALGEALSELDEYTRYHFGTEEALMDDHNYPGALGHKQKHRELVKQLNDLVEKSKAGSLAVTMETMNFLQEWLAGHILGMDKKLSEFLASR